MIIVILSLIDNNLGVPVDGSFSAWSSWFKCAKNDNEPLIGNDNNPDTCFCRTRSCNSPGNL